MKKGCTIGTSILALTARRAILAHGLAQGSLLLLRQLSTYGAFGRTGKKNMGLNSHSSPFKSVQACESIEAQRIRLVINRIVSATIRREGLEREVYANSLRNLSFGVEADCNFIGIGKRVLVHNVT